MTIDETVREYENDFWYMIHNKYSKDVIIKHFYTYRRHLDQYTILERPEPENDFVRINRKFKEYIRSR